MAEATLSLRVPRVALARVFLRSLFLQAAWNPRGMQNVGFADAMAPALQALYADPAQRARATLRHLEFFNCHPYLAAAIVGGAVRLEERVAAGELKPEAVSEFKRALGPPFAALGDGFFWLALRPVAALAAAITVPDVGAAAVIVFLALYNSIHVAARVWLFAAGYQKAEHVVEAVAHARLALGTGLLKTAGALFAGVLAARAVLLAFQPHRLLHAALMSSLIVVAAITFPRLGASRAMYIAMAVGLALGGAFL
jgi:PTS system mannose-specific IID component